MQRSPTFTCSIILTTILVVWCNIACTPIVKPRGSNIQAPTLREGEFTAADGITLSLRSWLPKGKPSAVLLALHGFNDHSNFFEAPGNYLKINGIASYAYDQRGFGRSPNRGSWAGVGAYVKDTADALRALRHRYPETPIFLLGTSMGGAVAIVTIETYKTLPIDGIILSAPAVWARSTMPWYQRFALWLGANTIPWFTLTGRGLGITPSDNTEMLNKLGRDPLVIKETRIGALYGLVNLMDAAFAIAPLFKKIPLLILYGEKDEIIPKRPTFKVIERLGAMSRTALYKGGYHMLLRDLAAEIVWRDIAHWVQDPTAPLPSGADTRNVRALLGDNQ